MQELADKEGENPLGRIFNLMAKFALYQVALIEARFVNAFVGAQFIAPRRA
jgi:hypothetical protein